MAAKQDHVKQQEKQDAQSGEQLVFVYGTLKEGHRLHGHIQSIGAKFVGVGRILNCNWVMRDLGSYPALQPVEQGSGNYIIGEVYLTDRAGLAALDRVEHAPEYYKRYRDTVWIKNGKVNQSLTCTIYGIDGREDGNEWLWQCDIIRDGEWPAGISTYDCDAPWETKCQNCGTPDELDKDGLCDECSTFYGENRPMHQTYPEPETEAPGVESADAAIDFVVEKGVYITNDWGDMCGPYDSINAAVNALANFSKDDLECVNVMTIGFRIIRSGLDKDQLADIDGRTILQ